MPCKVAQTSKGGAIIPYLAELNIARLRQPIGHSDSAGFVDNIDRINKLAERMDGFIWRHIDPDGGSSDAHIDADPNVVVNLSVWRDVAALESFVWDTVHVQFYRRRAEWFAALEKMHFAMWWVDEDHRPTPQEANARLAHLQAHGPSAHAFDWAFLPDATRWREAADASLAD